jgi:hypothetical protein
MAITEIGSNQVETSRDQIIARLDHIDETCHEVLRRVTAIEAFIDEHRPALARGLSMLDPGAGIRKLMGGGKRG